MQQKSEKPAIKKMLRPGEYVDEQLPETWTEKDLMKLQRGESSGSKDRESLDKD